MIYYECMTMYVFWATMKIFTKVKSCPESSLFLLKLSTDLDSHISYSLQKTTTRVTLPNIQKLKRRQSNKKWLDLLSHDGQPLDMWGGSFQTTCVYIYIFKYVLIHLFIDCVYFFLDTHQLYVELETVSLLHLYYFTVTFPCMHVELGTVWL